MKKIKHTLPLICLLISACTNHCIQDYYLDKFKGVVKEKYLSSYKDCPTIELIDDNKKIHIIQLIKNRDTTQNTLWINMNIGDSVIKEEGLDYSIIKKDTTITVTHICSGN